MAVMGPESLHPLPWTTDAWSDEGARPYVLPPGFPESVIFIDDNFYQNEEICEFC
jgi:hypothetical protein